MAEQTVSTLKTKYTSETSRAVSGNNSVIKSLIKVKSAAQSAVKGLSGLKNAFKSSTAEAKHHTNALTKIADAVKRIAFYRAIRSAIKMVTQAFREGVNNLYQYSAALNSLDASRAKYTMDQFATTALYVKNSLGAMLMPVLQALLPVVNAVADAFVTAANAVNQFFHALKGEGMFTRAKKYATEYGDALGGAAGKAKELKKQVFGFDELNIFTEPSKGGGGSASGLDYSQMFEESTVASWLQNLVNDSMWESIGSIFAMKLNALVSGFDAEGFGKRLGEKLQSVIGMAFGFLETFNFKKVGEKLATTLNNIIYQVKWNELGHILATKFTALLDFAFGAITTFDFAAAAKAVSEVVVGFFNHLSEWIESVNWAEIGKTFFNKVYDFVTNIDFAGIAKAFFEFLGAAIGAAWETAKGFVSQLKEKVATYFSDKAKECGGDTILGFLKGISEIVVGIFGWIVDNVWTPFWNGINKAFGIESDTSSNMTSIGKAVINGFFKGLTTAWTKVAEWLSRIANGIKNLFTGIVEGIKNIKGESPRSLDFGLSADYFAEGGQPKTGSLFWAGESGAELVGQVGGRTTVTTHDQFAESMEGIMDNTNTVILQAAQALIQAIQSKDMNAIVNISDRAIVNAYDRGKTLAGGSLVV